jgi:hypothetical protein
MNSARSTSDVEPDHPDRTRRAALWMTWVGAFMVLAVATAGCRTPTATSPASESGTGALPDKAVPVMSSARHIAPGSPHEPYSTDPPTSGPHYSVPAKAGFYTEAPPDEQLVHNLEHGYVVIWYRSEDLSAKDRARFLADIQAAMKSGGTSANTGTPKLIAVPRPTLRSRLTLTSWGHLDELDHFDQQRILSFIASFRDQAPEPTAP